LQRGGRTIETEAVSIFLKKTFRENMSREILKYLLRKLKKRSNARTHITKSKRKKAPGG